MGEGRDRTLRLATMTIRFLPSYGPTTHLISPHRPGRFAFFKRGRLIPEERRKIKRRLGTEENDFAVSWGCVVLGVRSLQLARCNSVSILKKKVSGTVRLQWTWNGARVVNIANKKLKKRLSDARKPCTCTQRPPLTGQRRCVGTSGGGTSGPRPLRWRAPRRTSPRPRAGPPHPRCRPRQRRSTRSPY